MEPEADSLEWRENPATARKCEAHCHTALERVTVDPPRVHNSIDAVIRHLSSADASLQASQTLRSAKIIPQPKNK